MQRRDLLTALAGTAALLSGGFARPGFAQSAAPAQSGQPVGAARTVIGEASASLNGRSRPLATEDAILFDDLLRTGADSRLQVMFEDETDLTLGENANVLIDRYIYDPARGQGAILTHVLSGAFQFTTGAIQAIENRDVTVLTSHATMGVRGTRFWGGLLDGRYEVFVFDGEVDINNAGGTVTLRAGDGAPIETPFAAPGDVVRWGQDKIDRALATVAM